MSTVAGGTTTVSFGVDWIWIDPVGDGVVVVGLSIGGGDRSYLCRIKFWLRVVAFMAPSLIVKPDHLKALVR